MKIYIRKQIMKITVFAILAILLLNCCTDQQPKLEETKGDTPDWLNNVPPEDVLWGIGIGNLSTVKASCELAKFNAQTDISRQIAYYVKNVSYSTDQPFQDDLINKLNTYQNEFYKSLMDNISEQVSFELSELVKIERRTKTANGDIWYLLSIKKEDAENISEKINEYLMTHFESYITEIEKSISDIKREEAEKMLDDILEKLKDE